MIYKRSELGDNIGFSTIIDEKFKTCSLAVFFLTELSDDTAAVNTLATSILTTSSSRYRSYAALSEKLSELYGKKKRRCTDTRYQGIVAGQQIRY